MRLTVKVPELNLEKEEMRTRSCTDVGILITSEFRGGQVHLGEETVMFAAQQQLQRLILSVVRMTLVTSPLTPDVF